VCSFLVANAGDSLDLIQQFDFLLLSLRQSAGLDVVFAAEAPDQIA